MTRAEQRRDAGITSNIVRTELAGIYRDLRAGITTLDIVLADPPDALKRQLLIDVIRRGTRSSSGRRGTSITLIGRQALKDGVNLMLPVDKASARTRAWVAEYGYRCGPNVTRTTGWHAPS